ncbi:MAG TPA: nucleotidyltransferase family protein [Candidatus Kapabacteria bacterium]|nr:nucleotidyltransferase family protein [Candidatus Kapabacteria bacterium]
MKALLLAAGLGTRLRPITDSIPKCLVPVAGRPLLAWWMDLLAQHDVADVLINLHFLPEPVLRFAENHTGPVRIHTVMEPELLGSAGTLHANRGFFQDEEQFLILYADNLTDVDLSHLVRFNTEHPAPLTVGLFHAENPSGSGIVELDAAGTIVGFVEKPATPASDLASAGVFVGRPELFDAVVPDRIPYDFGGHVMPRLIGRMNGVMTRGYLRDVGTLESLARAEREWIAAHHSN